MPSLLKLGRAKEGDFGPAKNCPPPPPPRSPDTQRTWELLGTSRWGSATCGVLAQCYTLNLQGKGHQLLGEVLGDEVVLLAGTHVKLALRVKSLVWLQHLQVFLRRLVGKAKGEASVPKCSGFFLFCLGF